MQDNILSIDCTSCKLCKYTVLCRKNSRSKSLSQSCADHIHSILRRICGTHTLTHTFTFRIAAANRLDIDISQIFFCCLSFGLRLSVNLHRRNVNKCSHFFFNCKLQHLLCSVNRSTNGSYRIGYHKLRSRNCCRMDDIIAFALTTYFLRCQICHDVRKRIRFFIFKNTIGFIGITHNSIYLCIQIYGLIGI